MSYLINKTDGSLLTEIVDGTVDQLSTNLTLIGKNANSYGESLNENFVRLLENFASDIRPTNPIRGQIWFDITESRLKVYDGTAFRLSGGTVVASSMPSSMSIGDLWIDSRNKQLYFNDGISNVLAGPIDSPSNGIAVVAVTDDIGGSHNIITITISPISNNAVDPILLAIFSVDEFTLNDSIVGYDGLDIKRGFNFQALQDVNTSITNISDPINDLDVVNLQTLNNAVKQTPLAISLNTTNIPGDNDDKNDAIANNFLAKIFPSDEHSVDGVEGPICRVVVTNQSTVSIKEFKLINSNWTYQTTL
jgi:hypothetical protein